MTPARPRRSRVRRVVVLAIVLVVLLIGLRASLSAVLERFLPDLALREAGVRLEIANIDLSLLAGEAIVENVRVGWPDEAAAAGETESGATGAETSPLLEVQRVGLAIDWSGLLARTIDVKRLRLEGAVLRLVQRADGSIVLPTPSTDQSESESETETETAAAPEQSASPDPEATASWRQRLRRLEIDGVDVTLREQTSTESALDFTLEKLQLADLALDDSSLEIGEVSIVDPDLHVGRHWLHARMQQTEAADRPAAAAEPEEIASPFGLRIAKLDVEAADFFLRTPQGPLDISLRLRTSQVDIRSNQVFPVEIDMKIGEGSVDARVDLAFAPLFVSGHLAWRDLPLPLFLLFNQPELIPWLRSCHSSGNLEVELRTVGGDAPAALTAQGSAQIADFSLVDPDDDDLGLEWERLDVVLRQLFIPLDDASPRAQHVDFASLDLVAPRIVVTRPPEAVDRLLVTLGGAVEAPEEMQIDAPIEPDSPLESPDSDRPEAEATIEVLAIHDGRLRFVDRTVTPAFEVQIDALEADARDLRLPGGSVTALEAHGVIDGTGTFSVEGASAPDRSSLELWLKRIDLVPFDSLARASGWHIRSGATSLQSKVEVSNDRYEMKNELVLHGIEVSSDVPGQFQSSFGIPLDLAVALLREPNGDIDLTIPITGERDAVEVDLRAIVLDALQEAITGALAAPFKLMGMVVPGRDRSGALASITSEPGSVALARGAQGRIEALARVVSAKPEVAIRLEGRTSDVDRVPLALEMLRERVNEGEGLPKIEGLGLFASQRIQKALREGKTDALKEEDAALLTRLAVAQKVPRERFTGLAQARAAVVRDQLIAYGVSESSVEIGKAGDGDEPGVALDLRPSSS